MDDLLQDFIGETREMLAAIAGELVAWEADPADRARLDEIFRFVHTVKGSCGFLDLPRLARLSHAAEDALGDLRAGRRQPDAAVVTAVLRVVDRIGELAEAIETGASLPDDADQRLIAALDAAATETAAAPLAAVETHHEPVARSVSRTVRLPIELLDRLMANVSDMVLTRNELGRRLREAEPCSGLELAFDRLSANMTEMRDAIRRTRMQRLDNVFATLPRMVRDLSAALGKPVTIAIEGGDVELDREMIEMIRDPLTHIIRNAIGHGIEPPGERVAAGKPVAGRLTVRARQAGNQILIEVIDDGRGIDGDKVAARAIAVGLIAADRAAQLSASQKVELIFAPGLSTADAVTTISGRGVGMDVVRANVERIGGFVDIESRPRIGLRVTLRVPLTLTIIPALTVAAGGQRFAIPRAAIVGIVRVCGGHVRIDPLGDAETATIRGRRLPVVRLGALLGLTDAAGDVQILVVVRSGGGLVYALAVEMVHDHEDLVVKPIAPALMAAGVYAGMTLPNDGRPMLLLDAAGVAGVAGVPAIEPAPAAAEPAGPPTEPTLLFTDLDGAERAVRLAVVERIVDAAADTVIFSAGRMRLVEEGGIVPLEACRPIAAGQRMTVLRLGDGAIRLAYAIAGVIDIGDLPAAIAPAPAPGPIAGVMLVAGKPVELIDPFWPFAEAAHACLPDADRQRPTILLGDPNDGWARDMLRPLVEEAGYRVAYAGDDIPVDLAIDTGVPGDPGATGGVPVIRLRTEPAEEGEDPDGAIWRYDRVGVMAAIARAAGGAGG